MRLARALAVCGLIALCTLPAIASASSSDPHELFYAGNIAFANSDYAKAEQAYRAALQSVESAELHFNLANALARQEHHSIAALHLLRAHTLAPRMDAINGNLLFLQSRIATNTPFPLLSAPANLLPKRYWVWLAAALFWLAIALICHRRLVPMRSRLLGFTGYILLLVFCLSLFAIWQHHRFLDFGMVIQNDVPLRVAPTTASPGLEQLPIGQPGRHVETINGFQRVQLPNGAEGFLALSEFSSIKAVSEAIPPTLISSNNN